eukprot:COSAG02_NODE_1124_length_14441_cov_21.457607_6_plen_131_part_00
MDTGLAIKTSAISGLIVILRQEHAAGMVAGRTQRAQVVRPSPPPHRSGAWWGAFGAAWWGAFGAAWWGVFGAVWWGVFGAVWWGVFGAVWWGVFGAVWWGAFIAGGAAGLRLVAWLLAAAVCYGKKVWCC